MERKVDVRVDTRGLSCPIPLVQLRQAMQGLQAGQTVQIIGNDPIFEATIRDFCQANGDIIVSLQCGPDHAVTVLMEVGV